MNTKSLFIVLKSSWKSLIFLLLLIITVLFFFYHYYTVNEKLKLEKHQINLNVAEEIGVKAIKDGWVYEGPMLNNDSLSYKSIFANSGILFFVEKHVREFYFDGDQLLRTSRSFIRDDCYIRALDLSNGNNIFRTPMIFHENPIQVLNIYPWNNKVVVYGYYQETYGDSSPQRLIIILDSLGNIINQFHISSQLFAVDEKNDLLICSGLKFIELPSGQEKYIVEKMSGLNASADKDGNIYIITDIKISDGDDKYENNEANVAKYSIIPWNKLWSVNVEGDKQSYPFYINCREGMLYVYCFESTGNYEKGKGVYPTIILDPNNGAIIKTRYLSDAFIDTTIFEGRKYIINQKINTITVSISPSVSIK